MFGCLPAHITIPSWRQYQGARRRFSETKLKWLCSMSCIPFNSHHFHPPTPISHLKESHCQLLLYLSTARDTISACHLHFGTYKCTCPTSTLIKKRKKRCHTKLGLGDPARSDLCRDGGHWGRTEAGRRQPPNQNPSPQRWLGVRAEGLDSTVVVGQTGTKEINNW